MTPEETIALAWSVIQPIALTTVTGILVDLGLKARLWVHSKIEGQQIANTAQDKANMEREISAALGVAVHQMGDAIAKDGLTSKAVREGVANAASAYLTERFPDRAARIAAAAPGSMSPDEAVALSIAGRIGALLPPAPTAASGSLLRGVLVAGLLVPFGLGLAACTQPQQAAVTTGLATAPGQLFCALQTAGGGTIVQSVVQAKMAGADPTAQVAAVLAMGAAKSVVDENCAKAAIAAGAVAGVPSSPPLDGKAGVVAIVPAAGTPLTPVPAKPGS